MSEDEAAALNTTSSTSEFSTSPSQCASVPTLLPSAAKSKSTKTKDFISEFMDRAKFDEAVEHDREDYEQVLHQKRMAAILNENKFLMETDWMYPSVEYILGFKDERPISLTTQYESAANLAEAHMFRVSVGAEQNNT